MRVGANPNSRAGCAGFTPIVLTCVTHLPSLEGYHAGRFEVVRTCLESMRRGHEDLSVMVWDNGSCDTLRAWLQDEYKPDHLILSTNIGKNTARTCMAKMLPPDRVMAYCDDDVYFYPGWLEASQDLLATFPKVSLVTGYPVRTAFRWGCEKTIARCKKLGEVETGRFIPDEWERDFAVSIGRDPDWHVNEYTTKDLDTRVTYKDKQAYCTGHHCQFIAPVSMVGQVDMWITESMPDEKPFDIAMDKLGLRLATVERYTRHIGNVMEDWARD